MFNNPVSNIIGCCVIPLLVLVLYFVDMPRRWKKFIDDFNGGDDVDKR